MAAWLLLLRPAGNFGQCAHTASSPIAAAASQEPEAPCAGVGGQQEGCYMELLSSKVLFVELPVGEGMGPSASKPRQYGIKPCRYLMSSRGSIQYSSGM